MKIINKQNKLSIWSNKHIIILIALMTVCSIIYYLPYLGRLAGWSSVLGTLDGFHNFYGIDFYGLLFFIPVVYAAYTLGVMISVLTAIIAMFIFLPHSLLAETFPNALFKPTAFVIILSAVGAVVAMIQRIDLQQRQRMKEMKCIYDVGKAADESSSVEEFLNRLISFIPQAMPYPNLTSVRINVRDQVFQSPKFLKSKSKIMENVAVGGEVIGSLEIFSTQDNPYVKKRNYLAKTLAERISGAIHEIELKQSLQRYYEQLEEDVEKRTKDLEQVQEKLIRSEKLAAVGELASGVGHELRNPLNVIRNCAYLINMYVSEKGDEEALSTIKVLDKQVDIANKIITDLLDFTRVRPPTQSKVDLNSLIKETLSWVTIPESIKISTNFNGHPIDVKTDAEQIGRVFGNLISNAVQAMNGKGELQILTSTENGFASAQVLDNGCGITEENLEKIFEPLFTTKPKGIGLGLAITKRLVEQNGGKIEVSSQVGKGTAFTVTLPA
jgi:signal transduction histidine kinase